MRAITLGDDVPVAPEPVRDTVSWERSGLATASRPHPGFTYQFGQPWSAVTAMDLARAQEIVDEAYGFAAVPEHPLCRSVLPGEGD